MGISGASQSIAEKHAIGVGDTHEIISCRQAGEVVSPVLIGGLCSDEGIALVNYSIVICVTVQNNSDILKAVLFFILNSVAVQVSPYKVADGADILFLTAVIAGIARAVHRYAHYCGIRARSLHIA